MDWLCAILTVIQMQLIAQRRWQGWIVALVNSGLWMILSFQQGLWGLVCLQLVPFIAGKNCTKSSKREILAT